MKAWLITWNPMESVDKPVVSILDPRLDHKRVKEHLDQIYLDMQSFDDRLEVIRGRRELPDTAQYHTVKGVRFFARMHCGHNPHLYARKVENLRVVHDEDGEEQLKWDEIPMPDVP